MATTNGLRQRRLRVAFVFDPNKKIAGSDPFSSGTGTGNAIFDETLSIRVRIKKAALAIQNQAVIEITGLSKTLRQELLSQFSAYNLNQRVVNGVPQPYVDVYIAAGYAGTEIGGARYDSTSQIYHGQVVMCDLVSPPPNVTVRIVAYTKQVNRTQWVTVQPPGEMTFAQAVRFAGNQMGFDDNHITCETSIDNQIVINMFASKRSVASLLPAIQDAAYPDIAAFIDDDFLIVKDRYKIIDTSYIAQLNEFIGAPCWTEWGVEGVIFMDPSVRLASAATFTSIMNPSLNGTYIVMELEYDLCSRETPFYVKVNACPAATD